ncbi:hypothetical protein [Umezawaea tangerina]|uniref:DUF1918 domain-containing protein n=1 Tax=Umezawaea tangerina TaxID=84725 RepID=A0A2T0SPL9_9PSEU|nr:hypothetical protein [Umezawaea tangerina]PRY35357.1 hypothetical protein CLV43_114275 [Umezawaea tangerina]
MDRDQTTAPRRGDFVVYHGSKRRYDGWVMQVERVVRGEVEPLLYLEAGGVRLRSVRLRSVQPDTPAAWGEA